MKKTLLLLLFTVSLLHTVSAQTYYKLEHVTGTKIVGTIPITVRPEGIGTNSVTNCYGPYRIGEFRDTAGAYNYIFSLPVTTIRLQMTNMGYYELVGVNINNNFYPISSANLSPSTCGSSVCIAYNGYIAGVLNANSFAQVDIHPGYFIDSVKVFYKLRDTIDQGGINYGFYYGTDPHVYVHKPVLDSTVCAGDSLQIRYDVSDVFDTTNIFKVQLSDATGNFTNGQFIGSFKGYVTGAIWCKFPSSLPAGGGYRYRVIASKPADTSADDGKNLHIITYPILDATSNSPVCEGKILSLKAIASNYDSLYWTGPHAFLSGAADTSFISTLDAAGAYSVSVSNQGCTVRKQIAIDVKPVPFITSIHNNSPVCEGEILKIVATANDTAGVGFEWTGPNGFVSNIASPAVNNVTDSFSGTYTAIVTQLGCISAPDTTTVVIKHRPRVPAIATNSPLEPAQDLSLNIPATPNATYAWTGPDGFNSTEQSPTIKEVGEEAQGSYYVTVTLDNCTTSAETQVQILKNALHFYILPNPSDGNITIKGNYRVNKTTLVRLVNLAGQTIYSDEISTPTKFLNMKLDMRGKVDAGVYILKAQLRDKKLNMRLVINQ